MGFPEPFNSLLNVFPAIKNAGNEETSVLIVRFHQMVYRKSYKQSKV